MASLMARGRPDRNGKNGRLTSLYDAQSTTAWPAEVRQRGREEEQDGRRRMEGRAEGMFGDIELIAGTLARAPSFWTHVVDHS